MVDKINEQISALIDDELSDEELPLLMKRLASDDELQKSMHRYQMMSQAIKDELPFEGKFDLSAQINQALDEQAEQISTKSDDKNTGKKKFSVFDQVTGFAIAATVAVVAVLVVKTVPENSAVPAQIATQGTHWISSQPMVESKLNAYLVKHNQSVVPAFHGANNVRLVGYDTEVKQQ